MSLGRTKPLYDFDDLVFTVEHGEFKPSGFRRNEDGVIQYYQANLDIWHDEVDIEKVKPKKTMYQWVCKRTGVVRARMFDRYGKSLDNSQAIDTANFIGLAYTAIEMIVPDDEEEEKPIRYNKKPSKMSKYEDIEDDEEL